MLNVSTQVVDGKMVLTVDLAQEHGSSKSGKTVIIASSRGNVKIDGAPDGVRCGLNVYRYAKPA